MTDPLVEWLRGVLDEDEARVGQYLDDWQIADHYDGGDSVADMHRARWAIKDIAAKHRILDAWAEAVAYYDGPGRSVPAGEVHGLWTAVQHLAYAYRSHPGYRPEWAPTEASTL